MIFSILGFVEFRVLWLIDVWFRILGVSGVCPGMSEIGGQEYSGCGSLYSVCGYDGVLLCMRISGFSEFSVVYG